MDDEDTRKDTRKDTDDRPGEGDQDGPDERTLGLDADDGSPEEEGYGYGV